MTSATESFVLEPSRGSDSDCSGEYRTNEYEFEDNICEIFHDQVGSKLFSNQNAMSGSRNVNGKECMMIDYRQVSLLKSIGALEKDSNHHCMLAYLEIKHTNKPNNIGDYTMYIFIGTNCGEIAGPAVWSGFVKDLVSVDELKESSSYNDTLLNHVDYGDIFNNGQKSYWQLLDETSRSLNKLMKNLLNYSQCEYCRFDEDKSTQDVMVFNSKYNRNMKILKNIGDLPAGFKCDAIHVSIDVKWSIDDNNNSIANMNPGHKRLAIMNSENNLKMCKITFKFYKGINDFKLNYNDENLEELSRHTCILHTLIPL